MKIYYVFNIKKDIFEIYHNTPSVLFNFLNRIYMSNKEDLNYANILFKQVANKYNKELLDLKIFIKYHNKLIYSKRKEEHIINNLYKNEISIMKIKRSYIIINSNSDYTEFFKLINYFYKNCLVCDFNNSNYFYIEDIKSLV